MKDMLFSGLAAVGWLILGLLHIAAGSLGMAHLFGWGAAAASVFLLLALKFPWPLMVGCFVGATEIWGWQGSWAVLLACSGAVFLLPGMGINLAAAWEQQAQDQRRAA